MSRIENGKSFGKTIEARVEARLRRERLEFELFTILAGGAISLITAIAGERNTRA